MSRLFASGSQCIGASTSASVLQVTIQGWFSLGWTSLISLFFTLGDGKKSQRNNTLGFAGCTISVATPQLYHCYAKQPWIMYMDDGGWVPIKLYVWTWTLECHRVFTCHEIYRYYFFPNHLKARDCSWTVAKPIIGWIWPIGLGLPISTAFIWGRYFIIHVLQWMNSVWTVCPWVTGRPVSDVASSLCFTCCTFCIFLLQRAMHSWQQRWVCV